MTKKTEKNDTLQSEANVYTVQIDQDTVVSVEATSAQEAVLKAEKELKKND